MTKQCSNNSSAQPEKAGAPDISLPYGGLVVGIAGDRGVAVYPGQSAEEVLRIAAVIERELDYYDIDHYTARSVAREVLKAITA